AETDEVMRILRDVVLELRRAQRARRELRVERHRSNGLVDGGVAIPGFAREACSAHDLHAPTVPLYAGSPPCGAIVTAAERYADKAEPLVRAMPIYSRNLSLADALAWGPCCAAKCGTLSTIPYHAVRVRRLCPRDLRRESAMRGRGLHGRG